MLRNDFFYYNTFTYYNTIHLKNIHQNYKKRKTRLGTQLLTQRAKKVVSDSPGLVDFPIRLVNSVLNLPDGPGKQRFFGELKLQKYCKTSVLNS